MYLTLTSNTIPQGFSGVLFTTKNVLVRMTYCGYITLIGSGAGLNSGLIS